MSILMTGVGTFLKVGADPFLSRVKLLMGFEGTNGSTGAPGLTDESPAAHGTATSGASSTIDTSQFKFGTSSYRMHTVVGNSCVFSGNSQDWLLSSANSDQFTIEGFARFNSLVANGVYIGNWSVDGDVCFSFDTPAVATTEIRFQFSTAGTFATTTAIQTSGASITTNTWYAICVDKDATGKIRLYVNGVMLGSSTPANSAFFDSAIGLGIGCSAGGASRIDGWLDEWRITKGIARYGSDSGYAVPVVAFPRS